MATTLPAGVTNAEVESAFRNAQSLASRRARGNPALEEVATDAATDAVLWALKHYQAEQGNTFEAFAAAAVKSYIWRKIAASARRHENGPKLVELTEFVPASERIASDSGREVELPESVKELPEDLRDAVRFFYLDQFDMRECGLLLGCSAETVRQRLQRAAKLLAPGQAVQRGLVAGNRRLLRG